MRPSNNQHTEQYSLGALVLTSEYIGNSHGC